jgi:hypothetical protein
MSIGTESERIAIVDLADDLQVRKQRIFKILPRLGIRASQRREPERGNQNVATVSTSEAAAIRAEIQKVAQPLATNAMPGLSYSDDIGFFYLIQLEPDHDPGRFKLGFTMDLDGRLQKHRCSAPFASYVKTWLCKRTWERAAIDCCTAACEQLHTEIFRAASLVEVAERASAFFSLMPALEPLGDSDDQSASPRVG